MTKGNPEYQVRNYQILAIGLGSIIIGQILEAVGAISSSLGNFETYAHLVQEFGFAFVIGFIISFAIERVSRQEFNETLDIRTKEFNESVEKRIGEIQQNVFHSTFARTLSDDFIREVEELIFNVNFVRHEHSLTYQLSKCHAKNLPPPARELLEDEDVADGNSHPIPDIEVIDTDVTMSYEIENISLEPQKYDLRIDVEMPPFPALNKFVQITSLKINGQPALASYELKSGTRKILGRKSLHREIGPIAPSQRVKISGTCRTIKMLDDSEFWKSFVPSEGMNLRVHFPQGTKANGAVAVHRNEIAVRRESDLYCEWAINGPVLPHQGIIFWWRCSDPNPVIPPEPQTET